MSHPEYNYFHLLNAYYELEINVALGLSAHSTFLALLHKGNLLRWKRPFPMSNRIVNSQRNRHWHYQGSNKPEPNSRDIG